MSPSTILKPQKRNIFNPLNAWRIFSQKGLNTGISSSPQHDGLSILGSQSTDPEQLKKDFGCCCKEAPRSRICFHNFYALWLELEKKSLTAPFQEEDKTKLYTFGYSEAFGDPIIQDGATFPYIINGDSVDVPWYQTRDLDGPGCDIVIDYFRSRCQAYPYLDPYDVKEFIESGGFYLTNTEWGNNATNDEDGCGDKIAFEDHMISLGSNIRRGCNTISNAWELYNNSNSPLLTNVMVQGAATAEIVGGTEAFTTTNRYEVQPGVKDAPGCPGGNVQGMGDRLGDGALLLFGDSNMFFGGTHDNTYAETFDQYYQRTQGGDLPASLEIYRGQNVSTFRRNLMLTSIQDLF